MSAESSLTAVAVVRALLGEDTGGLAVLLPDGLSEPGRELVASLASLAVLSARVAARAEGITEPSRLSRVSGPVRLTRIRPGSRSRTRVVISAARVVLPIPPIPDITIPASEEPVRSAGQRRCSRRRPTKYPSSRPASPASPAIRGAAGA